MDVTRIDLLYTLVAVVLVKAFFSDHKKPENVQTYTSRDERGGIYLNSIFMFATFVKGWFDADI